MSHLYEKIKNEEQISADLKIHQLLQQHLGKDGAWAVDVPMRQPFCLRCQAECPGFEVCKIEPIPWLWRQHKEAQAQKKTQKLFNPYLQRPCEVWVNHHFEEPLQVGPAMGSNTAPLLARSHFISRRLASTPREVMTRASVWRIGSSLGLMKSQLRSHRHSIHGEGVRRSFVKALIERNWVFIYEQDRKILIENNHAFESFIVALTVFLSEQSCTEDRPEDFPKNEDWPEIPKINIKTAFG